MRKALLIISVLAMSMLLSGCSTGSSGNTAGGGETTPFVGGTEGITVDFMDGAPPPEVYDAGNYPFEVAVRLQNKGETDVPADDVKVEISGVDPADFGGPSPLIMSAPEDLLGTMKDANGNIIDGTITYLSFPGFNYVGNLSGNMLFTLRADLCYTYENIANTKLCVIKDVLNFNQEKVCEVNEVKTVQNSGGPIQVTSFEQSPMGQNSISFTFEVSHAGLGEISSVGSGCNDSVSHEDKVLVTVDTGLDTQVTCPGLGGTNSGVITMYGGKRTVRCTQDVTGAATNYEKVITITTEYDYHQSTTKTLLVKHVS